MNFTMAQECPICFENIDVKNNRTTTECGHCFHTSCLMKNITHNGFNCPCCRSTMAEEQEEVRPNRHTRFIDDEDDDSEYDSEYDLEEEDNLYSDSALRGFRRLFRSDEDQEEEEEEDDTDDTPDEASVEGEEIIPNIEHVLSMLTRRNISMRQLLESLYIDHIDESHPQYYDIIASDNLVYGKIRGIIVNYQRNRTRQGITRQT